MRMLWRLKLMNQRWRIYDHFLVGENRWRAQRYGMGEGLMDFGRRELVPFADLLEELIEMVAEDADVLECRDEVDAARNILAAGNGADRQRRVRQAVLDGNGDEGEAMRAVLGSLVEEFHADL